MAGLVGSIPCVVVVRVQTSKCLSVRYAITLRHCSVPSLGERNTYKVLQLTNGGGRWLGSIWFWNKFFISVQFGFEILKTNHPVFKDNKNRIEINSLVWFDFSIFQFGFNFLV